MVDVVVFVTTRSPNHHALAVRECLEGSRTIHPIGARGTNFVGETRVAFHRGTAACSATGPRDQFDERPDTPARPRGHDAGSVDEDRVEARPPRARRSRRRGSRRSGAHGRGGTPRIPSACRKIAGSGLAAPTAALVQTAAKRSATPSPARTSGRRAVPVADHREGDAGAIEGVERRKGVRGERETQGLDQDLRESWRRRDIVAQSLGQNARALQSQGRQRSGVASQVEISAVIGDLAGQRRGDALGRVRVPLGRQQGSQARRRVVEVEEGSEGVEENRLHRNPRGMGDHGVGSIIPRAVRRRGYARCAEFGAVGFSRWPSWRSLSAPGFRC